MPMMISHDDEDEVEDVGDDGNVPGYGYYITLLCCFSKVSPWNKGPGFRVLVHIM